MNYTIRVLLVALVFSFWGCQKEDDLGPTQFDTSTPELSELDMYLRDNFVDPYNIEIQYKYDINQINQVRILYPPDVENVRPLADVLLEAWIEPYSEVGGEDFIKEIAPRMFTFVGSFNFNQSATITLGLAEAGTKITLFNINFLDFDEVESIKRPLHTVQHEYGHILNQTRPYDRAFLQVNPENYTAQWFNRSDEEARELGYITAYASSEGNEDFVEMISMMLTNSEEDFNALVNGISNEEARNNIRIKEQMIIDYYDREFDIDFQELRTLAYQSLVEVTQ